MNEKQLARMTNDPGFIAALDQSGGSTPKALKLYGIDEGAFTNADGSKDEEKMYDLVHQMRTRIIKCPSFTKEHILAAILFKQTMDRQIDGKYTADYLWDVKGIVPILKIDSGLAEEKDNVQLMKPMPELDKLLAHGAQDRHIFGTKERSVIKDYNEAGIQAVVAQQFEIAKQVISHGMVPIIEPEVDIHNPNKDKCEKYMHDLFIEHLAKLNPEDKVMFKVTIPTTENLYADIMKNPHVVRVVALSGGYTRDEANELLAKNHGLIASFSRALAQGLSANQSDAEFNATMKESVDSIYAASVK